jgi:hypothetical protein
VKFGCAVIPVTRSAPRIRHNSRVIPIGIQRVADLRAQLVALRLELAALSEEIQSLHKTSSEKRLAKFRYSFTKRTLQKTAEGLRQSIADARRGLDLCQVFPRVQARVKTTEAAGRADAAAS